MKSAEKTESDKATRRYFASLFEKSASTLPSLDIAILTSLVARNISVYEQRCASAATLFNKNEYRLVIQNATAYGETKNISSREFDGSNVEPNVN